MSKAEVLKFPGVKNFVPGERVGWENGCIVTLKVDGSQFTANVDSEGNLTFWCRENPVDPTNHLFTTAVRYITAELGPLMTRGYTYHFECINPGRHGKIPYPHVFTCNVILYALQRQSDKRWAGPSVLVAEAKRLKLDHVDFILETYSPISPEIIQPIMDSIEKGSLRNKYGNIHEGVVVYIPTEHAATRDGWFCMLLYKFVRKSYREINAAAEAPPRMNVYDFAVFLAGMFTEQWYVHLKDHIEQCGDEVTEETMRAEAEKDIGDFLPQLLLKISTYAYGMWHLKRLKELVKAAIEKNPCSSFMSSNMFVIEDVKKGSPYYEETEGDVTYTKHKSIRTRRFENKDEVHAHMNTTKDLSAKFSACFTVEPLNVEVPDTNTRAELQRYYSTKYTEQCTHAFGNDNCQKAWLVLRPIVLEQATRGIAEWLKK